MIEYVISMVRDEEAASDTRDELMAATYRVLASQGFAGLTTQQVADEADRTQALVYYHYETKEDLLVAFLEWIREKELNRLADLEDGTATERLQQFLDQHLSITDNEEHARFDIAFLEFQAAAAQNDRYQEALSEIIALIQEHLISIINEGIEAGEFRDVDPGSTARFLRYGLHSAIGASLALDEEGAKEQTREAAMEYVQRTLLKETN